MHQDQEHEHNGDEDLHYAQERDDHLRGSLVSREDDDRRRQGRLECRRICEEGH